MVKDYLVFLGRAFVLSFTGSKLFYAWMTFLTVLVVVGGNTFMRQVAEGLGTTGMTDQVSWGIYIANFTFLVGLAASAVMLVIPAYVYRKHELHDTVIFGELLAIAAIVMSMSFVLVDLGRPDRFWHLIPGWGMLNFPTSILAWDVIVMGGYLLLNLHICGYLLYMRYLGRKPTPLFYIPFVFISIAWAISIHTVTAFLFVALVGRPFWNTAIVAPRFLGSAFTAGPAILIIAFQIMHRFSGVPLNMKAIHLLRNIVTAALLINLFLLGSETFKEFYAASEHSLSAEYLFFGLHHHGEHYNMLVPWIWTALVMEVIAATILIIPPVARRLLFLNIACIFANIGIWIEKGMGLVVPGFIPSPQGMLVEYYPTWTEALVSIGVWAFGLLLFSWLLHLAIPIMKGQFRIEREEQPQVAPGSEPIVP
jgi:Ni/Fe-hydrogenase subunit HybB-like protein